jgi:hypothetical protein
MSEYSGDPAKRQLLFVSPVQPIGGCSANGACWDKPPGLVRMVIAFLNHPGLSFRKANLPCRILEYPTRDGTRLCVRNWSCPEAWKRPVNQLIGPAQTNRFIN